MNVILIDSESIREGDLVTLNGRHFEHIRDTLKSKAGDKLKVGLINGQLGYAELIALESDSAELKLTWDKLPPAKLPINLVIALPRPKMLKRIIQTATTMGVQKIYFINSWKVEKSFWQSPWLSDEKLLENAIIGLEQGIDTVLPEIHLRKLFKPFVEDELPTISQDTLRLVAHPGEANRCPVHIQQPCTLAIGPEGGFTPYEVNKLKEIGFEGVHLGDRILRVETAVPVLLSRLYDF